jgi:hypothetical protein
MKPFNLEEYKQGKKVVTRSGLPVTQLVVFDAPNSRHNLYGVIGGHVCSFYTEGGFSENCNDQFDLFMAPEVNEGWINIYPSGENRYKLSWGIFNNEQEAIEKRCSDFIATVKITWEE